MRYVYLCLIPLLVLGCTRYDPRPEVEVRKITKYGEEKRIEHYGPWFLDRCTLTGGNSEFVVSTRGEFNQGNVYMKFESQVPLARPPKITINVLDGQPILVDGSRSSYGFDLPFKAYEVAKYADEYAYIFFTYYPLGSTQPHEGYLALKPLLSGLGALSRKCD